MTYPTAFFVHNPFAIDMLQRPHSMMDRKPYIIKARIILKKIDYENFIADMTVSRQFIEDNLPLMYIGEDGVWRCILVQRRGRKGGVLVMSEGKEYPKWAAYLASQA